MATLETEKPFAISMRLLLWIYAVIPVVFLIMLADTLFFGSFLKHLLTIGTTNAPIYLLLLELPHIIASFIGYADTEYLKFYKQKLFIRLPIILIVTLVLIHYSLIIGFGIYLVYTMYHSVKQQTGIAGLLIGSNRNHTLHTLWTTVAVVLGIIGNLYVFMPQFIQDLALFQHTYLLSFFAGLLVCVSLYYFQTLRKAFSPISFWYSLATTTLLLASYACIMVGYLFFAIFLIRFVHDATAFVFYTVHDSNRNAAAAKNFFYIILRPTHLPVIVITPILGVLIAYYLRQYGVTYAQSATLVTILGFTHYYIESFMWKHESLHRRQLRFVP